MTKTYKSDVAKRITAHLKRFEKDKVINAAIQGTHGQRPYHNAHCSTAPRGFSISYVSYQGTYKLTTEQGELYLVWLDEGNVGRHTEALSDDKVVS